MTAGFSTTAAMKATPSPGVSPKLTRKGKYSGIQRNIGDFARSPPARVNIVNVGLSDTKMKKYVAMCINTLSLKNHCGHFNWFLLNLSATLTQFILRAVICSLRSDQPGSVREQLGDQHL